MVAVAALSVPLAVWLALLPLREDLPSLSLPAAVTRFSPLPEETLMTAFARGQEYVLLGQFEESLIQFNRAAELAPDSPEVLIARGITEEKLLKWEDAIEDYRRANDLIRSRSLLRRDDAVCMSNLANAELGLGRWEDALRDFSLAIGLRPNYEAPVIGKALALYQLGRDEEATTIVNDLCRRYPYFADAKAASAVIHYRAGRIDSALDQFEEAVDSDERYADIPWVANIRRWTPRLVADLEAMLRDERFREIVARARSRIDIEEIR